MSDLNPNLTFPTIHSNGTSAQSLLDGYNYAFVAVEEAIEKIAATGPHGRDYYPQGNETLSYAVDQHRARLKKLREVADELLELAKFCCERA